MAGILKLRKGDALSVRATFTDPSTGDPFPTVGWTMEATIQFAQCPAVDLTCTWVSTSPGGIALLTLTKDETADLHETGEYQLQARAIDPSGNPHSTDPVTLIVRD